MSNWLVRKSVSLIRLLGVYIWYKTNIAFCGLFWNTVGYRIAELRVRITTIYDLLYLIVATTGAVQLINPLLARYCIQSDRYFSALINNYLTNIERNIAYRDILSFIIKSFEYFMISYASLCEWSNVRNACSGTRCVLLRILAIRNHRWAKLETS